MVKCESATMEGGSSPVLGRASELRLYGDGEGSCPCLDGEVPGSSRSVGEREERAVRRQERASWLALAVASIPLFVALMGPSQATEEKVQVDVSVIVVENHVVVNPGYAVKVKMEESAK